MQYRSKKRIFIAVAVIALLVITWLFVYHPLGGNKMADQIEEKALTSNVSIIQENTWLPEESKNSSNATSEDTSWSAGASGTVIKREGDRYYVLTAYHIIKPEEGSDISEILIADYNDEEKFDPVDYQKYQDLENFYKRLPKGRVEFFDKSYDLAVISFVSKEDYATIEIADKSPRVGDMVGTLSNPREKKRNSINTGRIIGLRTIASSLKFYGVKHPMLTHTSLESDGSSGGMVLNENLQLIGVTLGGTEIKFFSARFSLTSKAMPCGQILEFLKENGFQI